MRKVLGIWVLKEQNHVTLSLGQFDKDRKGFVIIDWNEHGDIVTLPQGTRWKFIKDTFCLMNNNSISNNRRKPW